MISNHYPADNATGFPVRLIHCTVIYLLNSLNNRGQMVQLRGNLGRAPKEPSSSSSVSTQSFEITFTGSFHENNKRVNLTMDNFFVAYTGKDGRDGIHGRVEDCFYSSCSGKYYGYAYTGS